MISNWRQGVFTLLKKRKCLIINYKSKVPWSGGCWRTEAQCLTDWLILPPCWPHSAGYLVPGPWRTETKSQGADQRCLDTRPQQHLWLDPQLALDYTLMPVQYNCSGLCIVCIDIIQSYRNWRWFYLHIKNILVMVIHLYGGCSNVIVNICFDAILANGFSFTDSEQDLCCCLCGLWFVFCPLPQSLYAIRIEITMPLSYFILVQLCCCLVGE